MNDRLERYGNYCLWALILFWRLVKGIWHIFAKVTKFLIDIILVVDGSKTCALLICANMVAIILFLVCDGMILGQSAGGVLLDVDGQCIAVAIIYLLIYTWISLFIHYLTGIKLDNNLHLVFAPIVIIFIVSVVALLWQIVDMPISVNTHSNYAIYKEGEFVGCNIAEPDPLAAPGIVNVFKNRFVLALPTKGEERVKITDSLGSVQLEIVCQFLFTDKQKYLAACEKYWAGDQTISPADRLNEKFKADVAAALRANVHIWQQEIEKLPKILADTVVVLNGDAPSAVLEHTQKDILPAAKKEMENEYRRSIAEKLDAEIKKTLSAIYPEMEISVYSEMIVNAVH